MSIMEKMNKHIFQPQTLEIEGDEFELLPLGSEHLTQILAAGDASNDDDFDRMYEITIDLCKKMLIDSFEKPSETSEDDWIKIVDKFLMGNFVVIMGKFYEIHHLGSKDEIQTDKELSELRKRVKKNAEIKNKPK